MGGINVSNTGRCVLCNKPTQKGQGLLSQFFRAYCSSYCEVRANLIRSYGLTVEEYRSLTSSGRCPICNRKVKKWQVDHNHTTGEVYGVVCSSCNQHLLAGARHNPAVADGLKEFLLHPPARQLRGEAILVRPAAKKREAGSAYWLGRNARRRISNGG